MTQLVRQDKASSCLHSFICVCFVLTASPASQVGKGPSVPTYGSPAYWPAELARPLGVWRGAGRWRLLLKFGLRHAVHFDRRDREESPGDETSHGM